MLCLSNDVALGCILASQVLIFNSQASTLKGHCTHHWASCLQCYGQEIREITELRRYNRGARSPMTWFMAQAKNALQPDYLRCGCPYSCSFPHCTKKIRHASPRSISQSRPSVPATPQPNTGSNVHLSMTITPNSPRAMTRF